METLMSYCNGGKQEMVQNLAQETAQNAMQNPERVAVNEAPEESVQDLKQDAVQNGEQANEQGVQNSASEVFVQNEVQDMKQNLKQDGAPETAQDVKQKSSEKAVCVEEEEPAWQLPQKKIRPALTTISLRVTQEEKAALQKLAEARDMSMGEFFAAIARSIIAHAAGRDSRAA